MIFYFLCYSDVGGYRIVGCPKSIEDNRYARNALIFNFVFVFEEETTTTTYEPVIQKLGNAFRTYEVNTPDMESITLQCNILLLLLRNFTYYITITITTKL